MAQWPSGHSLGAQGVLRYRGADTTPRSEDRPRRESDPASGFRRYPDTLRRIGVNESPESKYGGTRCPVRRLHFDMLLLLKRSLHQKIDCRHRLVAGHEALAEVAGEVIIGRVRFGLNHMTDGPADGVIANSATKFCSSDSGAPDLARATLRSERSAEFGRVNRFRCGHAHAREA